MLQEERVAPLDSKCFRIGGSLVDITPPLGTCLAGYFTERKADGILDPLKARALVCSLNGTYLAIIACDLIGIEDHLVHQIRKHVQELTTVPPENVFVCCTHTHLGPCPPRYLTVDAIEVSRELYPGEVAEEYWNVFPNLVAGAVADAARRLNGPAQMGIAVGREETIAFNRRFVMRDGTVKTNAGIANPDIARPAGPIDPQVTVIQLGPPLAILVNFTCHLDVIGGTKMSADYPAHMISQIQAMLGKDVPVVFVNGCCGDINHVDVRASQRVKGQAHAIAMGKRLAAEALRVQKDIQQRPVHTIGIVSEKVTVPVRKVSSEDLAQAKNLIESGITRKGSCSNVSGRAFALGTIALANTKQESFELEVQALRIGELAMVGLPGEIFVEIGLAIKQGSPFEHTIVVELANGWLGYIPTRKAFSKGGYETTYRSAKLDPKTADILVQTSLRLLEKLKRG